MNEVLQGDEPIRPSDKSERALKGKCYKTHVLLDRSTIEEEILKKKYYEEFDVISKAQKDEAAIGIVFNTSKLIEKHNKLYEEIFVTRKQDNEIKEAKTLFRRLHPVSR